MNAMLSKTFSNAKLQGNINAIISMSQFVCHLERQNAGFFCSSEPSHFLPSVLIRVINRAQGMLHTSHLHLGGPTFPSKETTRCYCCWYSS